MGPQDSSSVGSPDLVTALGPAAPENPTPIRGVRRAGALQRLARLRAADGGPVWVMCRPVAQLLITAAYRSLPGLRPKPEPPKDPPAPASPGAAVPPTAEEVAKSLEVVGGFLPEARPIIEAGAFLELEGREVQAFYFGGGPPPHPDCLAGEWLSEEEAVDLCLTITELSETPKEDGPARLQFPAR